MKLTLRDLFWLVLVVGILCAWWLDRSRYGDRVEQMGKRIEELEAEIAGLSSFSIGGTMELESSRSTHRYSLDLISDK
jgi:ribose/xylose/arabinose/galactoside ABC-type transport system permease subunit